MFFANQTFLSLSLGPLNAGNFLLLICIKILGLCANPRLNLEASVGAYLASPRPPDSTSVIASTETKLPRTHCNRSGVGRISADEDFMLDREISA